MTDEGKKIKLIINEQELQMLINGLIESRDKKLSMTEDVRDIVELLDQLRNFMDKFFRRAPQSTLETYQNPNMDDED